jgi:hypothetical protein
LVTPDGDCDREGKPQLVYLTYPDICTEDLEEEDGMMGVT